MKKNIFQKTLVLGCLTLLMLSQSVGAYDLASGSKDGIKIWDSNIGQEIRSFQHKKEGAEILASSADGTYLASVAEYSKKIRIWDPRQGKLLTTLGDLKGEVFSLSFSSDGKYLASSGSDNTVKIWDTKTWKVVRTFDEELSSDEYGHGVTFSDKYLVYRGTDAKIKIWDISNNDPKQWKSFETSTINKHMELMRSPELKALAFFSGSADFKLLAYSTELGYTEIWHSGSPQSWGLVALLKKNGGSSLAFGPGGTYLALGLEDGKVKMWEQENLND